MWKRKEKEQTKNCFELIKANGNGIIYGFLLCMQELVCQSLTVLPKYRTDNVHVLQAQRLSVPISLCSPTRVTISLLPIPIACP
jgi:hypothetical protein